MYVYLGGNKQKGHRVTQCRGDKNTPEMGRQTASLQKATLDRASTLSVKEKRRKHQKGNQGKSAKFSRRSANSQRKKVVRYRRLPAGKGSREGLPKLAEIRDADLL